MGLLFAFIISFTVLMNPAAAAAVQSDSYAAIFDAADANQFVDAMNRYFSDYLTKNDTITTNYLVSENQTNSTILANEPLRDTFSIQEHYFNVVRAETIEFLITLGTNTSSVFQVLVSNSTISEEVNVTVSKSNSAWNKITLQTPLWGSIDVNITGISTQAGDTIPTFSSTDMLTTNETAINSTSSYYHSYTYTTTTTTTERYWDGMEWIYYPVTHQVTHTGWKTDLLNAVPAIRIENKDILSYKYAVEGTYQGHYKIYKHIYKNSKETALSPILEAYADYPSYIGYNVTTPGVVPNFLLDGIPLDQLLMDFLQEEGLASTSFDVNTFLNNLFTLLQDPANTPIDFYTTVENEASQFLDQMNGPYDDSHPTKYVIDDFQPASKNMTRQLGLFRETWGSTQQCIQWIWDYSDPQNPVKVCQQYQTAYLRLSTATVGLLSLASSLDFPSSLQNILLLKTDGMVTYPSDPYFFHWLAETTQTMTGIQYNQTLLDQIAASTPLSPQTNTVITSLEPYTVNVNVTDAKGQPVYGNVPITLINSTGGTVGQGTSINGTAHVTTSNYFENVTAVTAGNDFYMSSQDYASAVQKQTTTQVSLPRPYEANVTVTDMQGNLASGPMNVFLKYKGSDNHYYFISTNTTTGSTLFSIPYAIWINATVEGNGYYACSNASALPVPVNTIINASLVLNATAPKGTSPYELDITVTDEQGNLVSGSQSVTISNETNFNFIRPKPIVINGTVKITLTQYYDSLDVVFGGGTPYYISSGTTVIPQYDLGGMIQTQGPDGSNATENAKFQIIRDYIVNSTAFDYNPITETYQMNNNDSSNTWTKNGVTVGYAYGSSWNVSQQELDSGQFNNDTFFVDKFYEVNGTQHFEHVNVTKMEFFNLWLGMKLAPAYTGDNPPVPSYYHELDNLAGNYSTLLHEPYSFFDAPSDSDKSFIALVQGSLQAATKLGFPTPKSTSWWQGLLDLANKFINFFLSKLGPILDILSTIVHTGVKWIMGLWNNIIAPVMGAVIEAIKSIVIMILQQIVNTVVQPILSDQTTSINDIFGGVSPDTIASYGPSVFSNIETSLNSQSSQLSSVGSTMQSMMSGLSVFSGAGTILEPLISIAGPGIMVTVISMIASVVMSAVLTPLFSQFNSSILQNDLDTLMAPLGGTQNGSLAILDNIASLTSVTSQTSTVSQDSVNGYIAQSTGSSVGTTGTTNPLNSAESSSGTCDITAIGTCLAPEFNNLLLLSQTLLDNSNGAFSVFINVAGELLTAMETLTGSSSTSATSTVAPAMAMTTASTTTTPATTQAQYALMLGALSIAKDLLGYIKTGTSDKVEVLSIQMMRLGFDCFQFLESILYSHEYPTSRSSFLWFVKSGVSLTTNIIATFNDWNTLSPKSFLDDLAEAMGLDNFNQASQELKIITQSMGAFFYGLYLLNHSSSLSISTKLFMGVYIVQKFLKIAIFILKGAGIENSLEKNLYAVSAGINVVQMILSILGIG